MIRSVVEASLRFRLLVIGIAAGVSVVGKRGPRDEHEHARAYRCGEQRANRCHRRRAFRLHLTITRLVVVRPALGLVDLTLPLPRNLYLQPALFSFF